MTLLICLSILPLVDLSISDCVWHRNYGYCPYFSIVLALFSCQSNCYLFMNFRQPQIDSFFGSTTNFLQKENMASSNPQKNFEENLNEWYASPATEGLRLSNEKVLLNCVKFIYKFYSIFKLCYSFLVACTRLFKPLCWSVCRSVSRSVGRSTAICKAHTTYGNWPFFFSLWF